jgi:hypothetical protein
MLSKRIIACLDVRDGKLAKSIQFVNTQDIGDPVAKAREYYEAGIDELVFYDITASSEGRGILLDVVSRVAEQVFIPFSVGGGLRTVEDCQRVLLAGAEKSQRQQRSRQKSAPDCRSLQSLRRAGRRFCQWTCGGFNHPRPFPAATKSSSTAGGCAPAWMPSHGRGAAKNLARAR